MDPETLGLGSGSIESIGFAIDHVVALSSPGQQPASAQNPGRGSLCSHGVLARFVEASGPIVARRIILTSSGMRSFVGLERP